MAGFYHPHFLFETTKGQTLNSHIGLQWMVEPGLNIGVTSPQVCTDMPVSTVLDGCCLSYKLKARSVTSKTITTHFIVRLALVQDSHCLGLGPNPQYLPGLCTPPPSQEHLGKGTLGSTEDVHSHLW